MFFNKSFIPASGKSMLLFGALFLLLETMIEITGESILTKKYFSASGNYFRFFCQKKQFFRIVGTYFSTNTSFRLVETYFLSSGNSMLLFGAFFLLLETMIEIRGNQF